MIENLLKNGGFTNIVVHSDGTCDGTSGGVRYEKMHIKDHNVEFANSDIVKETNVPTVECQL